MVTVSRAEVVTLTKIIRETTPGAFVTVLQAKVAYGKQFNSIEPSLPLKLDEAGV